VKAIASHPSQSFFSFVSPLEVLVRQQSWEDRQAKKAKQQYQLTPSRAPSVVPTLDISLLDLPLFRSETAVDLLIGDPLVGPDDPLVSSDLSESVVSVGPEQWSEAGSLELHYILLERSLQYLAARSNPTEKLDVLNWIFRPETPEEVIRIIDGKKENLLVPFTFGACCRLQGLDPEALREQIEIQCRESGISVH
jgi:hypothetical protein